MNGITASAPVNRLPIQRDFSGESRRIVILKLRARVASDIESLKLSAAPEAAEELRAKQMALIAYDKMLQNSPSCAEPAAAKVWPPSNSIYERLQRLLEKPDWNIWESGHPSSDQMYDLQIVRPNFKKRPLLD